MVSCYFLKNGLSCSKILKLHVDLLALNKNDISILADLQKRKARVVAERVAAPFTATLHKILSDKLCSLLPNLSFEVTR